MKNDKMFSSLTISINKAKADEVIDECFKLGVSNLFVETGRSSVIEPSTGIKKLVSPVRLAYDPIEIINVMVEYGYEDDLMAHIYHTFDFGTPGRGSIHLVDAQFIAAYDHFKINDGLQIPKPQPASFFTELKCVTCIVQRGEGDMIANLALNSGACVPTTTYGTGSGVRDKLGLLRITIPANKDLVSLVISHHDLESLLELFITQGRLDEPGQGIVYCYPVTKGIVNTKISRGGAFQAASMEQVVSALDTLTGGLDWRRSKLEIRNHRARSYIEAPTELYLVCKEGYGTELMEIAMDNGAPGATIGRTRCLSNSDDAHQNSIREICRMIVSPDSVDSIATALDQAGAFKDEMMSLLYAKQLEKAFTYLGKTKVD